MKLVDLTLEITSDMITFPGYPMPTFIKWSNFETQGYVSETMFLSTHTGTHMDAPFHFDPNGQSIDQVEIERYVCNNAILLKIQKDSNQMISSDDIIRSSKCEIKEKDTIVFSTGWEKRIKQKDNYINNNPGLSKDAAEFLVEKKVNAVAIDCPSIDKGTDSGLVVHKTLLSNQILVIENLCNLYRFNNQRFTLLITPLKLAGASGSPIRAIGIEE
ncbi:MAG TPA: cyclase family protein [Candidatus Bathyarchaeia archaeon]|nr:cyclase family protein [Candidatus Bathyarchaeia archaeon]